uniref:OPR2 n=1 Tax=Arundo donax TaxID=35708 RepID=A0A0A9G9Z6_ARUDO
MITYLHDLLGEHGRTFARVACTSFTITNLGHHRFNNLKGKVTSVLQAASVPVGTVIDTIFHELLKEEAMHAMDFNSVKPIEKMTAP